VQKTARAQKKGMLIKKDNQKELLTVRGLVMLWEYQKAMLIRRE